MGPQSEGAGGGSECGVSEDTEKAGCGRNSRHTAPRTGTRHSQRHHVSGATAGSETATSRLLFLSLPCFPPLIHLNFFRLSDSFHHFWQLLRDKIIYRCIDSL